MQSVAVRRWLLSAALIGMVTSFAVTSALAAEEPEPFIEVKVGALPIILSAPHGGKRELPGVAPRQGEGLAKVPGGFVVARDGGTEELAREVAAEIQRRYAKPPFVVINQTHRKFFDPNRPPKEAYESERAKLEYDNYHTALAAACRSTQQTFKRGLLLDLHGQGTSKVTVYRGTRNGQTVTLLRERFGEAAHTGPESLCALLKGRGWTVHPDPHDGKEQSGFTGGYIVQHYGSHQGFGIDAMQLEFGGDYRDAKARKETARVLVDAVTVYASLYLDVPVPAR